MSSTLTTRWHSQLGQDEWVVTRSGRQRNGYFVEIGGYDGLRHSNTLTLEESFDWCGLLVEANSTLFKKLEVNRPLAKCIEVAIGPQAGSENFIVGDAFGGLVNYMPDSWYEEHRRRANPLVTVPVITLGMLLDAHEAPPMIDYLSLDVEGAEFAILEEYLSDPMARPIRYLSVEFRQDEETLERLKKLLTPRYWFDHVNMWDAFFVHKVWA